MGLDPSGVSLLRRLQNQDGADIASCMISGRECFFIPVSEAETHMGTVIGRFELDIEYVVLIEEETAASPDPCAGLTPREREIAYLIASGCCNKEIARQPRISCWTVQTHIRRAFTKLGIKSRTELTALIVDFLHRHAQGSRTVRMDGTARQAGRFESTKKRGVLVASGRVSP